MHTHTPPQVRYVLLKGCDERGFVFYTNYDSSKVGWEVGSECVWLCWAAGGHSSKVGWEVDSECL